MTRSKVARPAPRDDLEAYVAERSARSPDFSALMEAAAERRRLLRGLADARRAAGLTQAAVAARMGTSTSTVARLERGDMNPTLGTLERFGVAIGSTLQWRLA